MQDLRARMRAVKERLLSKPVTYSTLALLAWGLNGLDLQKVEFEQRGTIAISRQRLDALKSLAELGPKTGPYTFHECRPIAGDNGETSHSDMCTVRFRVRSDRYIELSNLEKYLLEKTEPREPSSECQSLMHEIRRTEWKRESLLHQCRCLDLQQQKESDYAAAALAPTSEEPTAEVAEAEAPEVPSEETPYRFTSYTQQADFGHAAESRDALRSELLAECRDCEAKIASLDQWLDNARAASVGFVSLTGAQQKYPVVPPVEGSRMAILLLLASSVWALTAIVMNRFPKLQPWFDRLRGKEIWQSPSSTATRTKSSLRVDPGVPFLGTIEIIHDVSTSVSAVFELAAAPALLESSNRVRTDNWNVRTPRRQSRGRLRIQQAAAVALSLWCAVGVFRLLLDSAWRELFLASPLAALTHLIAGVP